MNYCNDETKTGPKTFDFSAFPADTLFLDRRTLPGSAPLPAPPDEPEIQPGAPKVRKERRRRVDPTTFEKQYDANEIEFMNAVQTFKSQSGKMFPSHGDILKVALRLGYRKPILDDPTLEDLEPSAEIVGSL